MFPSINIYIFVISIAGKSGLSNDCTTPSALDLFSCTVGTFASSHQMITFNTIGQFRNSPATSGNATKTAFNCHVEKNASPVEVFEWEFGKEARKKVMFSHTHCFHIAIYFMVVIQPQSCVLCSRTLRLSSANSLTRFKSHVFKKNRPLLSDRSLYKKIKSNNSFLAQVFAV